MTAEERGIDVEIFGERYTLRAGEEAGYLHRISEYVDQKFHEVSQENPVLGPTKVAVLASLNIADELFKQREVSRRSEEALLARLAGLLTLLEQRGAAREA